MRIVATQTVQTVKRCIVDKHTTDESISNRFAYVSDTSSRGKRHICKDRSRILREFKSVASVQASTSPDILSLSLYDCTVSADFLSPDHDWSDLTLDLSRHLIQYPAATFFIHAPADSTKHYGNF